jgi:hypothetical protein
MTVPVALCEAQTAAATLLPIIVGDHRIDGGMPVELEIARAQSQDGTSGVPDDNATVAVWGADLPSAFLQDAAERHKGVAAQTVYDTALTYAAFANYNWIVTVNGVLIEQGAGAGKFQVSDQGGLARITFGTAQAAGADIRVHFVTPVAVQAATAAGTLHKVAKVTAREVMWVVIGGTLIGATNVYVRATV